MYSSRKKSSNIHLVSGNEGAGRSILVVEDDAVALDLLAEILRRNQFRVWVASSVDMAIGLLEKTAVDLVLSDLRMPDRDGMDLLRHIRENNSDLPVVLLSAFGDEHLWVEALSAGAVDLIPKPFKKQEIIDVINRTLSGRG
ncbi:MAG: response regulator [Nitrospiraceae bacterium]|nr:response regulator [Nitrospiraceae bacterium]